MRSRDFLLRDGCGWRGHALIGEKIEEYVAPEDRTELTFGTSSINLLEYELDGEKGEDISNHSCNASTPIWRQRLEEK